MLESREKREEGMLTETLGSCCGSRRQAHKAWLAPRPVSVRYLGSAPIMAVGLATRNRYEFSPDTPTITVDARDAVELLRLQDFRIEQS